MLHSAPAMAESTDSPASESPTAVVELAANLDDLSAELIGSAQQALLAAGALDVWTQPIGMKKQRPGTMLCLLCRARDRERLAERMIAETGSFGVRFRPWERIVLDRRHERLATCFGEVRIKVGSRGGRDLVARPEYEDVRDLAERQGASVREVMESAQAAARQWLDEQEARR
ncbi:MAG: nickel insertion protein [Phycisphaeraceae bacterium]